MSLALGYAKALYETAHEKGMSTAELAGIQKNLEDFQQILNRSKESYVVFLGPLVTLKQKEEILAQFSAKMGLTPLTTQFLGLLVRKNRLQFLEKITDEYSRLCIESSGSASGLLVSADQVDEAEVNQVKAVFKKRLGKDIQFKVKTNPELIAGMKITVGGVTYDGTLQSKLQRMKDKLEGLAH